MEPNIGVRIPDISLPYELSMHFDALPKIPVLLLFNDADAYFPAICKVLFKKKSTILSGPGMYRNGWNAGFEPADESY